MKLEILQDVIANIDGKSIVLKEGDKIDVPAGDADNLVRGKYAKKVPVNTRVTKATKKAPVKKGLTTRSMKK